MTKRTQFNALLTALVLALLALFLPSGAFAASLTVRTTATPDALSEAGQISINVVLTNESDVLLEDVRISAHSLDETLGNFEPGSQKSYNITNFSIYPEEVGSGVTLTFYWLENGVEQSYEHFVPIALATLSPELYAERTASSTAAPSGSTVTLTYAVQNTGDLPLYDVTITDPILDEPIELGTLEVGSEVVRVERTITITAEAVSSPVITASASGSAVNESLDPLTISLADAKISLTVTPQEPTAEGTPLLIHVENTGNTPLSSIALTDETGSAVTEAFSLDVGELNEVTYTVNPTEPREVTITATATYGDGSQTPIVISAEPVTVEPLLSAEDIVVTMLVKPLRDSYPEPASVTFAVRIDNDSPTELYDFTISEASAGAVYHANTLAMGAQTINVDLNVSETSTFTFSATFHDANGTEYSATAHEVTVTIAGETASPVPEEEGGSSNWLLWVMIGFGVLFVVAMVSFVVVLVQSSRRREQEREAEELDRILAARQEQHKQDTARLQQLSDPRARRRADAPPAGLEDGGLPPETAPEETIVVRRKAPNFRLDPEGKPPAPREKEAPQKKEPRREAQKEAELDSLFEDEFKKDGE